jgi:hypothetical protein
MGTSTSYVILPLQLMVVCYHERPTEARVNGDNSATPAILLLQLGIENAFCPALRDDTDGLERITVIRLKRSFLLLRKRNFKDLIRKSEQV